MPESDGFKDRGRRFAYLVACENARRIGENPAVLAIAAKHLERFSKGDPHQRDGFSHCGPDR